MLRIARIMDLRYSFSRSNFDDVVSRGQNKKTTLQSSLLFCVVLFADPFLVAAEETAFVE